ncbi:MAG: 1-deoxy-D-xylulose-5-phosphate synthase [Muribaculaceae bacterium]|nr:1-deoxy-D-xylulose-5-phosphate synthase [Muribaculaceae bacterium]
MDLSTIKSPADIKGFDIEKLELLSEELRAALIKKLAAHGGHVGPNLGVVEATVALHYVFDAPKDEIVFDVSHQSYVHKMLTGRIGAFIDPTRYDEVTGYSSPQESEYDLFEIGHTSTSIALATGLAKARDLKGGRQNVVAFIGDASLGGGMALEALDYAPELGSNFIVVLNDNQMSIAENHGELYNHLATLRKSNGQAENNIFKALGYEYIYVAEGNDLRSLIKAFRNAKDKDHAVLVHINTMKGMGLPVAEAHKEEFHFNGPFDPKTGSPLNPVAAESYTEMFAMKMLQLMHADKNVVTLTAGTPAAIGFSEELRKQAGSQFVDVGIAEQDAVTMTAGLAKGGARPVMGVVSTFLQRAYDQLSHDVAINNLPAVFVDFYTGVYGMNDVTHLGLFDVAMVSNIPNIKMIAAANAEEYLAMIEWAVAQTEYPVVVRTPGGSVVHAGKTPSSDFLRYDVIEKGEEVAIIGYGALLQNALKAAELLKAKGIVPTVINARNLSEVDAECLDSLKGYRHVITIDDGILNGGVGQKIAAYLAHEGVKTTCLGLKNQFMDRYNAAEVLKENGMTPEQIAQTALE